MKDLPHFKITIDDEYSEGNDLGISMIAFTAKPAIITKGFAFSTSTKNLYFADELKYRICAPVMIPMEIYRCDSDEEYFVQFTSDEIEALHKKFMLNLNNSKIFNLEHNNQNIIPAYVLECILVDSQAKIDMYKQAYNIEIPMGTVMMTSQITDKDVYNQLIANKQTGYSIEGYLGLKLSEIKQKMNKMENQTMLPAGEYTDADGNVFTVDDKGVCTPKEKMAELTPEEIAKQKEDEAVKMAELTPEEIAKQKEAEAAKMATEDVIPVDAITYTKEEVDAKFEEIYKLIASLDEEKEVETETEPVELSRESKFSILNKFYENK